MIVVVLIAVASSVASLALRDPASTMLEREGARLAALLEGARGEARASGLAAYWEPRTASPEVPGFRFVGLPPSDDLPSNWLETGVTAEVRRGPRGRARTGAVDRRRSASCCGCATSA